MPTDLESYRRGDPESEKTRDACPATTKVTWVKGEKPSPNGAAPRDRGNRADT